MKHFAVSLAALFVCHSPAEAASLLGKRGVHDTLAEGAGPKAARKVSLFVRTGQVSTAVSQRAPLFGNTDSSTVEMMSSAMLGGRVGAAGPGNAAGGQAAAGGGGDCHPKCWWSCGTADCDETCDPVCAPPQCETACAPINLAACRQRCDPPKCAIVCPTQHCEHGGCPGCKTVCAPPKCNTECSEQCESQCADPQCTWKCNPGKCEKPRCSLTCGGAKACGLDGNLNARPPPFDAGMTVLAKGLAATDPKALAGFAAKKASLATVKAPAKADKKESKDSESGPIR